MFLAAAALMLGLEPGCLADLRRAAIARGATATVFDSATAGFTLDSTVLVARDNQPEFKTPIWDYLAALVDEERIADAAQRIDQWQAALGSIEKTSGVDRHTVVAVWGVESDFGRIMGQRPLVRSLVTGYCLGRRQDFFRDQLVATLQILERGDIPADRLVGSWAGAFGQTQFMPTTFLRLAVDADGDGRRDIVGSVPDALGSTANYLKQHGWVTGAPWGYEVRVPARYRGRSGRLYRRSVARWAASGVKRIDGGAVSGPGPAALLRPAGPAGPAFLVFRNFDVIYSYNAAESYALAIAHLADRLRGGAGFVTPWPTNDRGLSRAERREVQERLTALGHDVGTPNGVLGRKSREAIKAFQARVGLPVNGRAGGRVLDSLRLRSAPPLVKGKVFS